MQVPGERRVLVTGFEGFGPYAVNPSAGAAKALEARFYGYEGPVRVCALVLPVTYAGAPRVLRARARVERPHAVLLLGLAARATELHVERRAYNETEPARADNTGGASRSGAALEAGDEAGAARGADEACVRAVYEALTRAGAPVRYSDDPGRYVCNATYYAALAPGEPRSVFVHVPATECAGGALPDAQLVAWLAAAVEALAS